MPITVNGVAFPIAVDEPGATEKIAELVGKVRKRRRKLKAKLADATSKLEILVAQHAYFGSADARCAAMLKAATAMPYKSRLDIMSYRNMSGKLNISKPLDEEVYVRIRPKSSGGYRLYCDYGIKNRTAQVMVADALRAQLKPAQFQYDTPGRGVQSAIKAARQYINSGYRYGRHLDIKSFFDSISHEFINGPALIMAPGIKSAVLTGKHAKLVKGFDKGPVGIFSSFSSEIASAGITQGSATSPLVASLLLSKLDLGNMPEKVVVLNYADDFLILAKEEADLEVGSKALQAALAALSAGELTLAPKLTQSSPSDFVYLGHQFYVNVAGKPSITVFAASINSFDAKVSGLAKALVNEAKQISKATNIPLSSSAHHATFAPLVARLAGWIKAWLLTFAEADDVSELAEEFAAYINSVCDDIGLPGAEEIWAATQPSGALGYDEIAGILS